MCEFAAVIRACARYLSGVATGLRSATAMRTISTHTLTLSLISTASRMRKALNRSRAAPKVDAKVLYI